MASLNYSIENACFALEAKKMSSQNIYYLLGVCGGVESFETDKLSLYNRWLHYIVS